MEGAQVKTRVPRTRAGNTWTEARYYAFLRSLLRKGSTRWPPIYQALNRVRKPYTGTKHPRLKWIYQCQGCGNWFQRKGVEVDHIQECGELTHPDHIRRFVLRLFCEPEGLRVLCKRQCHQARRKVNGKSQRLSTGSR